MKTPAGVFVEIDKLFLRFMWKATNLGYQNNFQKRKLNDVLRDFKQKNSEQPGLVERCHNVLQRLP